jgi:hypothetical protein
MFSSQSKDIGEFISLCNLISAKLDQAYLQASMLASLIAYGAAGLPIIWRAPDGCQAFTQNLKQF